MLQFIRYTCSIVLMAILFTACEKEYSAEDVAQQNGGAGNQQGTAVFSFGASGACSGAVLAGTYKAGVALNATNTVTIPVTVTTPGTYTITTGAANGAIFLGTGNFTTTGAQNIVLTGTGTATIAGTYNFIPGTNGCSFSVTFAAPPGGGGGSTAGTFTVKLNGVQTTFNVIQATLLRSNPTNEKRFDLAGVSTDGKYRLIITVGEETSAGNGITIGDHLVRLFLDDDPATTEDESVDSNAFYTLSTSIGPNSWFTDVYGVKGNIKITANAPVVTTGTISGNFDGTLTPLAAGSDAYTLTGGVFTNITYTILN